MSHRRDADLATMQARLEEEAAQRDRVNRQLKDNSHRIQELQEELDAEKTMRSKAEKARMDLQVCDVSLKRGQNDNFTSF